MYIHKSRLLCVSVNTLKFLDFWHSYYSNIYIYNVLVLILLLDLICEKELYILVANKLYTYFEINEVKLTVAV